MGLLLFLILIDVLELLIWSTIKPLDFCIQTCLSTP
jgi:hypothetical protein